MKVIVEYDDGTKAEYRGKIEIIDEKGEHRLVSRFSDRVEITKNGRRRTLIKIWNGDSFDETVNTIRML